MGFMDAIASENLTLALIAGFCWMLGVAILLICRQWELRLAGVSCVFAGTMAAVLPALSVLGYA
jgi:hypothetical protein